jgi:hypothetical protein
MSGRLALLITCAALSVVAQPPESEPVDVARRNQIHAMLSSTAPDQLAWGAYLAAENSEPSFVPSIIPLLRHENPDVQLAAIDALIRLNAEVPAERLGPIRIDGRFDPFLALLAKNPQKYSRVLLNLLDESLDGTEWTAVNSILWMTPPRGYAARLLREWQLQVSVEVQDKPPGIGCGGCGYYLRKRPARDRSGFPPVAIYVINIDVVHPEKTGIPRGPYPISFVRQTEPRTGGPCISRDEYRKDYLQGLAQYGLPKSSAVFHWTTPAKYRTDADALLALIRKCNTELRQILLERGLLDPNESTVGLEPEFLVVDKRFDQQIPLPAIPWRVASAPTPPQ